VLNASPFGLTPHVPIEDYSLAPILAITAVTAGLVAAGAAAFRRRDLVTE
jgi:ABC-2 type transport system permease protein